MKEKHDRSSMEVINKTFKTLLNSKFKNTKGNE